MQDSRVGSVHILDEPTGEDSMRYSRMAAGFWVGCLVLLLVFIPPMGPETWACLTIGLLFMGVGWWAMAAARMLRMKVHEDHLELGYGIWPACKFNRINIEFGDVAAMKAIASHPFVNVPMPWPNLGFRTPVRGKEDWEGWLGVIVDYRNPKALAIESVDGNWIIGCKDPEEIIALLKSVAGSKLRT